MRKTTLVLGQLLRSVHIENSYLGKAGGLPGIVQRVTHLSKLPRTEQLQASDRAPRQSWLRGQWVALGQWVVPGLCD